MNTSNDAYVSKVAICLALGGLLLFGASFNDPFHFDDVLILNDSNVTNADRWTHFFNPLHLRQVTYFTFYLNHLVHGDSAAGYHIVNVALHMGNAILLFFLLKRFLDPWVAALAAAIFLAHPIQTESVLYVYQRSVLLACFFSLLALHAMATNRRRLAAILFFLAFESKESALAVPLLLLLLHPSSARMPSRAVALVLPLLTAAAALALLLFSGEKTVGIGAMPEISPISYFLTQTRVIYTYFRLLVAPYAQSLEYDFQPITSIDFEVLLQIAGLGAIVILAAWFTTKERFRFEALSILAFFILLAPTSSVIPSIDFAFEHRLYLPMPAFSVLAALMLARLPRRTVAVVPILMLLSVLTLQRGTVWSSDTALWEDAARHAPGKARVWFNLGGAYLDGNPDRADGFFERALALQPHFPEAWYNRGVIAEGRGSHDQAYSYYQRAVEQRPDYWPAWNNLGNALVALGRRDRALEVFENTLSLNPDYWPAQYNIAIVQYMSGRFDQVIPRLKIVLDWQPDFLDAKRLLAMAYDQAGQRREAEALWQSIGSSAGQPPMPATISAPTR